MPDEKDEPSLGDILGDRLSEKENPSTVAENMFPDDGGELWEALFAGGAPHATRFGIVPYFGYLRIGFAEQFQPGYPVGFRGAVTLSDVTAYELWKLLGQTNNVQYMIQQEREAEAAAQAGANGDKAAD